MTSYQPILKAKPAEFSAWSNAAPMVRSAALPLFELAPGEVLENYLKKLVATAAKIVRSADVFAVDAAILDQTASWAPGKERIIEWLAKEFAGASIRYRPVVRVSDSKVVLDDIAAAATLHGAGVILRVGTSTDDPDLAAFVSSLPTLLRALKLSKNQVHLLLDYRYVSSAKDVTRALPGANGWLTWLASQPDRFASVHIGSGAFPATISSLAVGTAHLLPRLDAALYNAVTIPTELEVGFADYAVNHPDLGVPVPRAPLPSLRYLVGDDWLVWRESKSLPGNESFFTVCNRVVGQPGWAGSAFAWGDSEIDRSAHGRGGAGTATQWRAYGTSHHLAAIVDRLARLGVA